MKNETLYNKTVDILVQAYFNDTLQAGECAACACGNIIAANNGYEIVWFENGCFWKDENDEYKKPKWINVVGTETGWSFRLRRVKRQHLNIENYIDETKLEIKSSGYSLHEFAEIEYAFEKGFSKNFTKDRMFNGLMSVIDVLDEIHENKDAETTKSTKQKFHKQLA